MSVWEIVLLFFSFQSFLFGAFLMIKKSTYAYANRLFAIFLFLFGYSIFFVVVYWSDYSKTLLAAIGFTYKVVLALLGPLLFFYIRSVVTAQRVSFRDLFHFLPATIVLACYGGYIFLPLERKLFLVEHGLVGKHVIGIPKLGYFLSLSVLFYGVYSYLKYRNNFPSDKNLRQWVKLLGLMFIVFGACFISYYIMVDFGVMAKEFDYGLTSLMAILIGTASFFCMLQPRVFNGEPIRSFTPFVKYRTTSGLPHQFARELKTQLNVLMDSKKPHLNPDLHLDDLALMMNISRHQASQLINEHFNKNFCDFINSYRIEEAKRLLDDQDVKLNMENIGYQCGFNNRSSFYRAFKKFEGLAPSEYHGHTLAS